MSLVSPGINKDFTQLKKPRDDTTTNIRHLRKISASQLFNHKNESDHDRASHTYCQKNMQRTISQPNLPQTERHAPKQFYTPSTCRRYNSMSTFNQDNGVRRNTRCKYDRTQFSRQLRTEPMTPYDNECFSSDKIEKSQSDLNSHYENLYEIIQSRLNYCQPAKNSSKEMFSNTSNEKIFSDSFLQESWEESVKLLETTGKLDAGLIEAIYLLRNAHKRGFFDENKKTEQTKVTGLHDDVKPDSNPVNGYATPPDQSLRSVSQCSLDSTSLPSSILYSSSEDTPINSSGPSSGRSTPSIRKRPKKPDIRLPKYHNYHDYIEIKRPESYCSVDSELDGSLTSENSFMNIPDDVIAQAVLRANFNSVDAQLHEFEETLREPSDTEESTLGQACITPKEVKKLVDGRPGSPTSDFLSSLLPLKSDSLLKELHCKLSPLLHKVKKLEDDAKKMSALQVKLAVLQEEKRQLAAMLNHKRLTTSENENHVNINGNTPKILKNKVEEICSVEEVSNVSSVPDEILQTADKSTSTNVTHCDASVQKYLEIVTEIAHQSTSTDFIKNISVGVGDGTINTADSATQNDNIQTKEFSCQNDMVLSNVDSYTETEITDLIDTGIGDGIADLIYTSKCTQLAPEYHSTSTQSNLSSNSVETMAGPSLVDLVNTGIGEGKAFIDYLNQATQFDKICTFEKETQNTINMNTQAVSVGCSFSETNSVAVQCSHETKDFSCGEDIAAITFSDAAVDNTPNVNCVAINTDHVEMVDADVMCVIAPETASVSVGEGNIFDVVCDRCSNTETCDVGVGSTIDDELCSITDKLCDCVKPKLNSVAVGDQSITDVCCDRCENLQEVSVGVGDCRIDDLLCDKCTKTVTVNKEVGDCKVDDLLCDTCENRGALVDQGTGDFIINNTQSVGIGESDVNQCNCDKCESSDDNVFNFDLNIMNKGHHQQAALCHYCGNKVDLDDSNLDDSLQAMRDSMQSINCGMKRSTAKKKLNLDFDTEDASQPSKFLSEKHSKGGSVESPMSDVLMSDDEEDPTASSGRNDVIEACQMLNLHFSREKPLKQQQMVKYMGIIQSLWFKTVKRRRANASVVKSYIDLFQQRIPVLMETIMNLTDDEGNTALHYAITYKNYSVVSILLDSGECAVDLVNQAGYSAIMLASLAGFEKKDDKYIMQRLFRMGDINKESAEAGQTPLMLAVSRGNLTTVELLLDAGCDINCVDDEGSTALMCACEHGIINIVKALLGHPQCDATIEDNEGSTALSIAMDARRKDLALLIYGSLNFDARGRIKLSPSKQSLLGLGRRSPSPVVGRR